MWRIIRWPIFGTKYELEGEVILESVYRFEFEVKDLARFINTDDNNNITISHIMPHLISVAIGTMRGILVVKTVGTIIVKVSASYDWSKSTKPLNLSSPQGMIPRENQNETAMALARDEASASFSSTSSGWEVIQIPSGHGGDLSQTPERWQGLQIGAACFLVLPMGYSFLLWLCTSLSCSGIVPVQVCPLSVKVTPYRDIFSKRLSERQESSYPRKAPQ